MTPSSRATTTTFIPIHKPTEGFLQKETCLSMVAHGRDGPKPKQEPETFEGFEYPLQFPLCI